MRRPTGTILTLLLFLTIMHERASPLRGEASGRNVVPVARRAASLTLSLELDPTPPYRVGERRRCVVASSGPAFVWVYCLETTGRVIPLCAARQLSGPEDGLRLEGTLIGPPGREALVALASGTEEQPAVVDEFVKRVGGATADPDEAARAIEREWLKAAAPNGRGFTSLSYMLTGGVKPSTAPAPPPVAGAGPRRVALVIGVGKYPGLPQGSSHQLTPGPEMDAALMEKTLRATCGASSPAIRVLVTPDETRRESILSSLREWLPDTTRADDQVVVYFSGHGVQVPDVEAPGRPKDEMDGLDEALCPSDVHEIPVTAGERITQAQWQSLSAQFILDDDLRDVLLAVARKHPSQIWLILDSCHSGTAAKGAVAASGAAGIQPRGLPLTTLLRVVDQRSLSLASFAKGGPASTGERDDIDARQEDIDGLVFLAACQPGELAYQDVAGEGGGLFTQGLIDALAPLSGAGADCAGPSSIVKTASKRVAVWVNKNQKRLHPPDTPPVTQIPDLGMGPRASEFCWCPR